MKAWWIGALFGTTLAMAQAPPDLGSGGVWLPRNVSDIAGKIDPPFLDWAKQRFLENHASKQNDTASRCLPPGVPRIMFQARPFEIVQTGNRILFIYEGGAHVWRQVWMDGRAHPKNPNPNWLGHSTGKWDAETLLVDSVGFNDKTWLDDMGHPHTEQLHVTERFTRTSPAAMKYEVTIDDPRAYARTWTTSSTLTFKRGERLGEDICLDKLSK